MANDIKQINESYKNMILKKEAENPEQVKGSVFTNTPGPVEYEVPSTTDDVPPDMLSAADKLHDDLASIHGGNDGPLCNVIMALETFLQEYEMPGYEFS